MASNIQILILFKNNENNRKKVSKQYSLYCQNRPSNISFGPPFQIFCPVLEPTKVGSAGHDPSDWGPTDPKPVTATHDRGETVRTTHNEYSLDLKVLRFIKHEFYLITVL